MALLPEEENKFLNAEFNIVPYPSKTYKMNLIEKRINGGYADELAAVSQMIYCALNTERSTYIAYTDSYGVEFVDLFGKPVSYVLPELERRITDAIIFDSRIEAVDNFEFEVMGAAVRVTFIVHTIYGDIPIEKEVNI